MTFEFKSYKFETDLKNNIHVYEYRNNNLKYFDYIKNNDILNKSLFEYKCKSWYSKNILFI